MNSLQLYVVEVLIILLIRAAIRSRDILVKIQVSLILALLPAITSYFTFVYLWVVLNQPLFPDLIYPVLTTFLSITLMNRDHRERLYLRYPKEAV